jgi:hypothetical protein
VHSPLGDSTSRPGKAPVDGSRVSRLILSLSVIPHRRAGSGGNQADQNQNQNQNQNQLETMNKNQFLQLCEEVTVDPSLALELHGMVEALWDQDDEEVARILAEEV